MESAFMRCKFCLRKKKDAQSLAAHVMKRHPEELVMESRADNDPVVADRNTLPSPSPPPSPPPPPPRPSPTTTLTVLTQPSPPAAAVPHPLIPLVTAEAQKLGQWARIMFEKYFALPAGKNLQDRASLLKAEADPDSSIARKATKEMGEMTVLVDPYFFVAKKSAILHLLTKAQQEEAKQHNDKNDPKPPHLYYHGHIILSRIFPELTDEKLWEYNQDMKRLKTSLCLVITELTYEALLDIISKRTAFHPYREHCQTKPSLELICRHDADFRDKVVDLFKGELYNPTNIHGEYTKEKMELKLLSFCRLDYLYTASRDSSIITLINVKVRAICEKFRNMGRNTIAPTTWPTDTFNEFGNGGSGPGLPPFAGTADDLADEDEPKEKAPNNGNKNKTELEENNKTELEENTIPSSTANNKKKKKKEKKKKKKKKDKELKKKAKESKKAEAEVILSDAEEEDDEESTPEEDSSILAKKLEIQSAALLKLNSNAKRKLSEPSPDSKPLAAKKQKGKARKKKSAARKKKPESSDEELEDDHPTSASAPNEPFGCEVCKVHVRDLVRTDGQYAKDYSNPNSKYPLSFALRLNPCNKEGCEKEIKNLKRFHYCNSCVKKFMDEELLSDDVYWYCGGCYDASMESSKENADGQQAVRTSGRKRRPSKKVA